MNKSLIIFIKNPDLGKVKTRIAKTTSEQYALDVYEKLLKITKEITLDLKGIKKYLYYDHYINNHDIWDNQIYTKRLQNGTTLGVKMKSALDELDHKHKAIIGSDCPELTSTIIENGFELIKNFDFVIGKAHDGGFYMLATRVSIGDIFEGIEWSTNTVTQTLVMNIEKKGYTYTLLPTLNDIDTEQDWQESKWSKIL